MNGSTDRYRVKTKHPDTGKYIRWRVRWELSPDPGTGDRRQGSKSGFATRREADAYLADVLGEVNAGTYVAPSRQRLGDYLTDWLDGIRVRPTTHDNYRTALLVHAVPRLGGVPLEDLTAEHVNALYRDLEHHGKRARPRRTAGVTCKRHGCAPEHHDGLAAKSVRHVHGAPHKALQDALERGHVGRNVVALADPPTAKDAKSRRSREDVWTLDQLRTFLAATQAHRLGPVWQFVATTGVRRAEVVGLRWKDVDLEAGRVTIAQTVTETSRDGLAVQDRAKTAAGERSFHVDPRTVASLRTWRTMQARERLALGPAWTTSPLVFTREDGHGHRPKRLSSAFTEAAQHAGLDSIGVHGLRHSYATAALRAGVSPEVVSKRLGHADVTVTLGIYAHAFDNDDQVAANRVADAIYGA